MEKLDNSLNMSRNIYDTAKWEFSKIDKDVLRMTGESPEKKELADGSKSDAGGLI